MVRTPNSSTPSIPRLISNTLPRNSSSPCINPMSVNTVVYRLKKHEPAPTFWKPPQTQTMHLLFSGPNEYIQVQNISSTRGISLSPYFIELRMPRRWTDENTVSQVTKYFENRKVQFNCLRIWIGQTRSYLRPLGSTTMYAVKLAALAWHMPDLSPTHYPTLAKEIASLLD